MRQCYLATSISNALQWKYQTQEVLRLVALPGEAC